MKNLHKYKIKYNNNNKKYNKITYIKQIKKKIIKKK